jgi:acyl-CoA reductase-like NAD-dependent aldehyde dehydrogenase
MSWENIAAQVPIVVAFIWFVLEMDKRNAKYAASRDNQWRAFFEKITRDTNKDMNKVTEILEKLATEIREHREEFRDAIITMETATKTKIRLNRQKRQ